MYRSAERGLRFVVERRVALFVALLVLWGMPLVAQDRVARPEVDGVAVLTYPFVVKVLLTERQMTPRGYVTSTRTYSEAYVTARDPARRNILYCGLTRVNAQSVWPCGAVPTGSVVAVTVKAADIPYNCEVQVPKVVGARRVFLKVTIYVGTGDASPGCEL